MLHTTIFEHVNVQLVVTPTHKTTIAALDYYRQREEHGTFKETAESLQLTHRSSDIVNVKSAFIHGSLNDSPTNQ